MNKKLLMIIHSLECGGAQRVCVDLSEAFAELGTNVTVATLESSKVDFFELSPAVKREELNMADESENCFRAVVSNVRRILALRKIIKKIKPDVVLSFMTTTNILSIVSSFGLKSKTFVSERIHPPRDYQGFPWKILRLISYPAADTVAVLTEKTKEWFQKNCPGSRVSVIPNPVAWPITNNQPLLEPSEYVGDETNLLLAVGRLDYQKGFDLLIKAFSTLAAWFPSWKLVILGEGGERGKLEGMIKDVNLQGGILLPGKAGNIAEWYEKADVYVMSSRFEGFPNTLTEALASGLPAVSYDCETGPGEIIRDGVDGILVPPGEGVDGLAAALASVLGDESLRKRFSERAVEARERFSVWSIIDKWKKLFGWDCTWIYNVPYSEQTK